MPADLGLGLGHNAFDVLDQARVHWIVRAADGVECRETDGDKNVEHRRMLLFGVGSDSRVSRSTVVGLRASSTRVNGRKKTRTEPACQLDTSEQRNLRLLRLPAGPTAASGYPPAQ